MGKQTRKQKKQTKSWSNFVREMNERDLVKRERELAQMNGILPVQQYPPEFFSYYGEPGNVSRPEDIEWRQRWNAYRYPNDPRHIRGTPRNQRRRVAAHRENYFPVLQNIQRVGRSRRQRNKLLKSRVNVVEELKTLPPIREVGFPGGNVYREAEEEWKSLAKYA